MDFLSFASLNAGDGSTYGRAYNRLSFFNSSHVDPGAEYQTTQDNLYGLALSLDNFEVIRVAASKFKDSRGQPVGMNHRLLIVGPDLERTAAQVVTNREDYQTGSRAMNPYAGNIDLLVAPGGWMDSTAWVLVDPTLLTKPINLQVRQVAQLVVWDDENAPDGGARYFKWHARYVPFYGDWRTAIMGNS
jgi:phage major head subunit gpT-like protein